MSATKFLKLRLKKLSISICRSSHSEVFCKKGVLKNFAKFTGKHLCQSFFLNKVLIKYNTSGGCFWICLNTFWKIYFNLSVFVIRCDHVKISMHLSCACSYPTPTFCFWDQFFWYTFLKFETKWIDLVSIFRSSSKTTQR